MIASWAALAFAATAARPLPLPDQIDIAEGFSTVSCPSAEAAETMFNQFHSVRPAPDNHTINVERFFEGLSITGCKQTSGPIVIDSVTGRRTLELAGKPERYIRYIGRDGAGAIVHGIVSEDGNNGYHRTVLAEWLGQRSSDGWLDARTSADEGWIFYRCETVGEARAIVAALANITEEKGFRSALNKALARSKCRAASDRYYVQAKFEYAGVECGVECFIELNALAARDRSGRDIGLIFDGALM